LAGRKLGEDGRGRGPREEEEEAGRKDWMEVQVEVEECDYGEAEAVRAKVVVVEAVVHLQFGES